MRRLVEQRPGPAAARHHQQVERLRQRLREVPIRHDRGAVGAFDLGDFAGDQRDLEGIGRRRRIVGAEEARDREGLDEAEDVDRLETVEDQDADPLGRRKGACVRHLFPPTETRRGVRTQALLLMRRASNFVL
jgi:hypothetical protein